jgi:flagellar hook assembly protein FlgD
LPAEFVLLQNYPNPFNPETSISFALPKDGQTTLRVYDITGKLIKTLIDEQKVAGYYVAKWNGKNENNEIVSSGLYLYQITSGEYNSTKRMLLLK